MKAHVVYADWQAMKRYERRELLAESAIFLEQPDLYSVVHTVDLPAKPERFSAEQVCEAMYVLFNDEDGKARELSIRSLSCGDLIIFEAEDKTTEVYACKPAGFENVSHLPHCGSWIEAMCNG